uniref:DZF domain-containing protein n=1 Tax=Timema genevievae TaxID=629358 RepID=A0A7R9JSY9_TIMGE|nr:unnamed protein product [Timema genevievae]
MYMSTHIPVLSQVSATGAAAYQTGQTGYAVTPTAATAATYTAQRHGTGYEAAYQTAATHTTPGTYAVGAGTAATATTYDYGYGRTAQTAYDSTKTYYQQPAAAAAAAATYSTTDTHYQDVGYPYSAPHAASKPAFSTTSTYPATTRQVTPAATPKATSYSTAYTSQGTQQGASYSTGYTAAAAQTTNTTKATAVAANTTYSGYDAALYSAATMYVAQQAQTGTVTGTTVATPTNTATSKPAGSWQGYKKGPMSNFRMKPKLPPKPMQLHYCDVCKISCAGPQTYREHLEGQKHKKKESALKAGSAPVARGGNALRCELCDVTCTGSDAYAAHIRGAKHQKVVKLHTKLGKPIPSTDPVVLGVTKTTTAVSPTSTTSTAKVGGAVKTTTLMAGGVKKTITAAPKINFVAAGSLGTVGVNNDIKLEIKAEPKEDVTMSEQAFADRDVQPVGLDYIEETKNEDGKVVNFNCKLCECKFNDPNAKEMHMKGRRHRLQFKRKVNPELIVDVKPSTRIRKIQEDRLRRIQLRDEYWRRLDEERMIEEEERMWWEERRHDRHVIARHAEIYPKEDELQAVQRIVSHTEKALKFSFQRDKDDSQVPRVLKGVMRVGVLAKGLLLHGDTAVNLVVLCAEKPTRTLLNKVAENLPKQLQARATGLPSCVMVIRILRDLCQRVPTWAPLHSWAMELLVEKVISSSGAPLSPGESLRRVLESLASGILLPGGPGLLDPCEKDPVDAAGNMQPQQREDITASAQIHKVLGMDHLPVSKFRQNRFNPRKRRRDNSSGEGNDSEVGDGKKDKKDTDAEKMETEKTKPHNKSEFSYFSIIISIKQVRCRIKMPFMVVIKKKIIKSRSMMERMLKRVGLHGKKVADSENQPVGDGEVVSRGGGNDSSPDSGGPQWCDYLSFKTVCVGGGEGYGSACYVGKKQLTEEGNISNDQVQLPVRRPRRMRVFNFHYLDSHIMEFKPRAITRRLCGGKKPDNELYRSNSFKFERFERAEDSGALQKQLIRPGIAVAHLFDACEGGRCIDISCTERTGRSKSRRGVGLNGAARRNVFI